MPRFVSSTRVRRWLVRLCLLGVALLIWAFLIEPRLLYVREHELTLTSWPAQLSGLRVAVLTDLHVGSPGNDIAQLRRVIAETQSVQPDLILITGDLVIQGVVGGTFVAPEAIARELGQLSAPLGTFAVLGNHDHWLDAARVERALAQCGIHVLENQAQAVSLRGQKLWLVGVSDFWIGKHDVHKALAQVNDVAPILLFTHNPDVFPDIPARVALTVAGHTHGGQVWLPLLGRPIVPSGYGERFAIGHIVESGRHLFVASGIGTSILPVRFCVPPEISLLTLKHP